MLYSRSVIRSVQYWNWVGFYLPFTCLRADGWNLSPYGAQTDGKMLVFSFQSSVLILLSSGCISQTDYACQAICNMCHDSLYFFYFFFFLTPLKIFCMHWHCLLSISLRKKCLIHELNGSQDVFGALMILKYYFYYLCEVIQQPRSMFSNTFGYFCRHWWSYMCVSLWCYL